MPLASIVQCQPTSVGRQSRDDASRHGFFSREAGFYLAWSAVMWNVIAAAEQESGSAAAASYLFLLIVAGVVTTLAITLLAGQFKVRRDPDPTKRVSATGSE